MAPELMGHVAIPYIWKEFLFHRGCSFDVTSILRSGLIAGGRESKEGRHTIFFTPLNPFGDNPDEEEAGAGETLAAPAPAAKLTTRRLGKIPRKKIADCTSRNLEAAKDITQQQRKFKPKLKKTEANTKLYDLNQRTMQGLNNIAIVYATFEQVGANLEVETAEGEMLFADVRTAKCLQKLNSTRNVCNVKSSREKSRHGPHGYARVYVKS